MRKPNVELNQLKLAQKELQYKALEQQLQQIKDKFDFVTERLDAKMSEIEAVRLLLSETGTVTPAVSE